MSAKEFNVSPQGIMFAYYLKQFKIVIIQQLKNYFVEYMQLMRSSGLQSCPDIVAELTDAANDNSCIFDETTKMDRKGRTIKLSIEISIV